MRVIAGSARGRQLATFAGRDIRPTPDRVREALFSILYSRRGPLSGGKVLDLYAGSGALGIEALSRGADHAWFVDSSRQAIATIGENLERCRLTPGATMLRHDVMAALPMVAGQGPFDLILADPPYARDLGPPLLDSIAAHGLLGAGGIFCLETAATDQVPDRAGAITRFDQRRYGVTMLHFFQPASEEPK